MIGELLKRMPKSMKSLSWHAHSTPRPAGASGACVVGCFGCQLLSGRGHDPLLVAEWLRACAAPSSSCFSVFTSES